MALNEETLTVVTLGIQKEHVLRGLLEGFHYEGREPSMFPIKCSMLRGCSGDSLPRRRLVALDTPEAVTVVDLPFQEELLRGRTILPGGQPDCFLFCLSNRADNSRWLKHTLPAVERVFGSGVLRRSLVVMTCVGDDGSLSLQDLGDAERRLVLSCNNNLTCWLQRRPHQSLLLLRNRMNAFLCRQDNPFFSDAGEEEDEERQEQEKKDQQEEEGKEKPQQEDERGNEDRQSSREDDIWIVIYSRTDPQSPALLPPRSDGSPCSSNVAHNDRDYVNAQVPASKPAQSRQGDNDGGEEEKERRGNGRMRNTEIHPGERDTKTEGGGTTKAETKDFTAAEVKRPVPQEGDLRSLESLLQLNSRHVYHFSVTVQCPNADTVQIGENNTVNRDTSRPTTPHSTHTDSSGDSWHSRSTTSRSTTSRSTTSRSTTSRSTASRFSSLRRTGSAEVSRPSTSRPPAQCSTETEEARPAIRAQLPQPGTRPADRAQLPQSGTRPADRAQLPQPGTRPADRAQLPQSGTRPADRAQLPQSGTRPADRAQLPQPGTRPADRAQLPQSGTRPQFISLAQSER